MRLVYLNPGRYTLGKGEDTYELNGFWESDSKERPFIFAHSKNTHGEPAEHCVARLCSSHTSVCLYVPGRETECSAVSPSVFLEGANMNGRSLLSLPKIRSLHMYALLLPNVYLPGFK